MVAAVIVAAGQGVRMKAPLRKQYHLLAGSPVLLHSLQAFDRCKQIDAIYLVIPKEDFDYCRKQIISPAGLKRDVQLIAGGEKRQHSVYNGILAVDDAPGGIVVIHDGVRPFIRPQWISACIDGARQFEACIMGLPAFETLKLIRPDGDIEATLDRDGVWMAQTPQAFRYGLIRQAHEKAQQTGYCGTDDADLVQRMQKRVKIIAGSRFNIKITTPEDIEILARLIDMQGTRP